ncbi:iron(III) transport system substrate-binding protein [Symbiobacterium terraclitae]|uniref:Iron(III) transport system substrate-binding protein n=1 Tax=Symbiobacterium terraclitae TaxID=557451 RepID=A0ABS4JRU2_9FIRM|nr:ABC transporter substrate-binding protein [Symbiobacterium terraclitae]MBP2017611.1 iron(III) transport system substrate-binding protein [Symbiobacterium terraclitae]
MRTGRRWTALLVALTLVLAGCGGGTREQQRMTLYTSFGADLYTPLVQAFEEQTGIKVDVVFGGTGELLRRLEAEKGTAGADVMLGGGAESYEAYRELFVPYTVKDDDLIPGALKAPDRVWYGFNALPMVIMYNRNLVPEDELPRGWADLADPRWQGRLAMSDATKSGTAFVQVVTMLTLFADDGAEGWNTVSAVVKNARVLGSSSLPPKGVDEGEYALALTHENMAWKYAQAGGPVGWIYPAEGTATIPDSVALVKGAPNPDAARKFMDFLFSREAQEMASRQLGLRASRTDVPLPEGLSPADEIRLIELDIAWATAQREAILGRWKDLLTQ